MLIFSIFMVVFGPILPPFSLFYGTVSKASEKRIFRDLLSRLIDQIEEPAPGFA
jgi:hypothetical protein